MPLAKCIHRCWDSKTTRRYWPGGGGLPGDQDDLPFDHPLVKPSPVAPRGCFQFVDPKDQERFEEMYGLRDKKVGPGSAPMPPLTGQKPRGNPNWRKKAAAPTP